MKLVHLVSSFLSNTWVVSLNTWIKPICIQTTCDHTTPEKFLLPGTGTKANRISIVLKQRAYIKKKSRGKTKDSYKRSITNNQKFCLVKIKSFRDHSYCATSITILAGKITLPF